MIQLRTTELSPKTRVLAVDDNLAALQLMEMLLSNAGYEVCTATNGREALAVIAEQSDKLDIILLDRMMPQMDGIELCRRLKADQTMQNIPVIMQTAAGQPEEIREGIEAGAFYYLVKPLVKESLLAIVAAARDKARQYQRQKELLEQRKESIGKVQELKCVFQTTAEAENLAAFLSIFFPDPERVVTGISELLLNAVEHGNLAIDYEEKGHLVAEGRLAEEVAARLADPRYSQRRVTVRFDKTEDGFALRITDEGEGFDWSSFMSVDPARVTHNHGRGIAMARIVSFDHLVYNNKGNEVTCLVLTPVAASQ